VKLRPIARAAACISFNSNCDCGFLVFSITATGDTSGTISLSNSSRFPLKSGATMLKPVAFPPGRARLATRPAATGSPMMAMTIGIVPVAVLSALAAGVPPVTMTSTLRPTRSAASSASPSTRSCPPSPFNRDRLPVDIAKVAQPFEQRFGAKRE
jgi:hypothetical protein